MKAHKFIICFILASVITFSTLLVARSDSLLERTIDREQKEIGAYIDKYCQDKGRSFFPIQNNLIVDCITSQTLWKITYAPDWPDAMVEALRYGIYDDYRGAEKHAPKPGIVLIYKHPTDYKYMVKLKQLIRHYSLPIETDTIELHGKQNKFNDREGVFSLPGNIPTNLKLQIFNQRNLY